MYKNIFVLLAVERLKQAVIIRYCFNAFGVANILQVLLFFQAMIMIP
jgi:hypothetical protein